MENALFGDISSIVGLSDAIADSTIVGLTPTTAKSNKWPYISHDS